MTKATWGEDVGTVPFGYRQQRGGHAGEKAGGKNSLFSPKEQGPIPWVCENGRGRSEHEQEEG